MASNNNNITLLSLQGMQDMGQVKIGIVATEWNEQIVAAQVSGAKKILDQMGAKIEIHSVVPGAFEIPFACKQIANRMPEIQAIIAFGAVIKGGTPHFEYVCEALVQGISTLNITLPIPVIFGVLTLNTEVEAWERLGGKHGHKGEEAAIAALKMIQFNSSISKK